jgi:hypothetical protein
MSKKNNLYLGKAGQLVAMAEFLARGWNVAVPEVDIGDDIFVVRDETGDYSRVQVKTSTGISRTTGVSAQFNLPISQIEELPTPELTYIFLVRHDNSWLKPLVLRRKDLFNLVKILSKSSEENSRISLYFVWNDKTVNWGKFNLTQYVNNFSDFPLIEH